MEPERAGQATAQTARSAAVPMDVFANPMFVLTRAGRVLSLNAAARAFCGLAQEEGTDVALDELCRLSRRSALGEVADPMENGLSAGARYILPFGTVATLRDGSVRAVQGELLPFCDADGAPRVLLSVSPLAEHQLRWVETLERNREQLHLLIERAPLPIYVRGSDGRLLVANAQFCDVFGVEMSAVGGVSDFEFLPPHVAQAFRLTDHAVATSGNATVTEHRIEGPRGTRIFLASRFVLPREHPGDIAVCCIASEISTIRALERELSRQQEEMARVSKLSTIGEFVSGVAHELNQPLSASLSYIQTCLNLLAGARLSPDSAQAAAKRAEAQIVRSGEVIQRLRNFVTQDNSHLRSVPLNDAVKAALALDRQYLLDSGVEPVLELDTRVPGVIADRVQLEQVVINLCRNAAESMMTLTGGRSLTVTTGVENESHAFLSVRDSGTGIPGPLRERIFDPFFTTKEDGMGMGLRICKTLVESFGGQIEVEASGASGTVMRVVLRTTDQPPESYSDTWGM